jgi:hypothetical protein
MGSPRRDSEVGGPPGRCRLLDHKSTWFIAPATHGAGRLAKSVLDEHFTLALAEPAELLGGALLGLSGELQGDELSVWVALFHQEIRIGCVSRDVVEVGRDGFLERFPGGSGQGISPGESQNALLVAPDLTAEPMRFHLSGWVGVGRLANSWRERATTDPPSAEFRQGRKDIGPEAGQAGRGPRQKRETISPL